MKTVTNGKDVKRVTDKEASQMVKEGWKYCPKSVFKSKTK